MGLLLHPWSELAPTLADLLVASAWQGALLALAAALCLRLAPRLEAARRWKIWGAAFVLVLALHLLPMLSLPDGGPHSAAPAGWRIAAGWSEGLVALWLALSLFRAAQLAGSWFSVSRLVGRATPVAANAECQILLDSSPRPVLLCTSVEVNRPSVAGFLRPRILLPPALLAALSAAEIRQVLEHELEHLRRHDDWTNLLQKAALVIFPLNPALLWLERRLCTERELACDERVLLGAETHAGYALCLTRIAEYGLAGRLLGRGTALVLGALGAGRSELARRVYRILEPGVKTMRPLPAGLLTAVLGVGLLGGAFALARSPQLVSFEAAPQTGTLAQAAPPLPAHGRTAMVLTRAVLPAQAGTFQTPAFLPVRAVAARHTLRRAGVPRAGAREFRSYTVVRTYAAVPVANGWVLIQL